MSSYRIQLFLRLSRDFIEGKPNLIFLLKTISPLRTRRKKNLLVSVGAGRDQPVLVVATRFAFLPG
jgi:hypothetical protein